MSNAASLEEKGAEKHKNKGKKKKFRFFSVPACARRKKVERHATRTEGSIQGPRCSPKGGKKKEVEEIVCSLFFFFLFFPPRSEIVLLDVNHLTRVEVEEEEEEEEEA